MLARLGDRLAAVFRATAPDPFVLTVLLTLISAGGAIAAQMARTNTGPLAASQAVLGFWQSGLWDLLGFGMQMCLILVTGHALASSPIVARSLRRIAAMPQTTRQGAVLTAAVAMGTSLINWGFGLIAGALIAREVIASLTRKGVRAPAGLIAAAGYLGLMVWHGGLSGSAPLKAATLTGQQEVLGADLGARIGPIPVHDTTFSTLNLVVTIGLVIIALLVVYGLGTGSRADESRGPAPAEPDLSISPPRAEPGAGRFPRWLETSPLIVWALALPAIIYLVRVFWAQGLGALKLDTAILAFLAMGLVLHGSAHAYLGAVEEAAIGCAGIILQFPLYSGIMGMVNDSGLGVDLTEWVVALSGGDHRALGTLSFWMACTLNMFIPSGGGLWAVQGPICMAAAVDTGMNPARMLMAIAYGDQITNMLQPFWALPLLAITRVPAREIIGYAAVVMLAGLIWVSACLWFF